MELQQVRYFLALARTLNFSRAAECCNVTQPALTKAIHKLEMEFGGKLFERRRTLIELTDLGKLVMPTLERALEASEAARRCARAFATQCIAPLRIGLAPSICAGLMADPLTELSRRIAGLSIELVEYSTEHLVEGLFETKLHAAITGEVEDLADRINHWPLFEESIVVGMAPRHVLSRHPVLPLDALATAIWLGRPGCDLWKQFLSQCFPIMPPSVTHRASRQDHLLSMAAAGLGTFLLPQHAPVPAGLVVRGIEGDPARRRVHLLTIAGRRYAPALDAFVKIARLTDWQRHIDGRAGSWSEPWRRDELADGPPRAEAAMDVHSPQSSPGCGTECGSSSRA